MNSQIQEYQELARRLESMELTPPAAARATTAAIDICPVWKAAKPFVEGGIAILRLLPFPWAKKLADALEFLAKALNALCP